MRDINDINPVIIRNNVTIHPEPDALLVFFSEESIFGTEVL